MKLPLSTLQSAVAAADMELLMAMARWAAVAAVAARTLAIWGIKHPRVDLVRLDRGAMEGLGVGGEGEISDILGYEEIFAGGGGGGMPEAFTSSKNGGLGGGGAGGILSSAEKTAQDGECGRGGGGGGAANAVKVGVTVSTTSGAGGNGIVIIRYCYQPRGLILLFR